MPRRPAPGTHDRILDTASRLFHDNGVRGVGLQQIIDDCGCGKNLLYREFSGKDDLVVAYLERCRQDWALTFDQTTGSLTDDPASQLVAIVRVAADRVGTPGYRGCPFLNVHAEFPDPSHPAHQIAVEHHAEVRTRLHELAARAGARDPELLADRIMLIIDGVYANGAMLGGRAAVAAAVAFAEDVVRAATGPSPATDRSPA